jgi:hypothetical protein
VLTALVGFQVAAGLILRGAWDSWSQALVVLVLTAGVGVRLAAGAFRGRVELPAKAPALWAGALILLSLCSALLSPVHAYALPSWAAAAAGLWLFPAATLLNAEERVRVEQAVRAAAWLLVLLAIYQRVHGDARPTSALPNQNVFAGAVLLLLPFAARRGDVLLGAGLLACLWWTRSVGAWLGLSVALMLNRRAVGAAAFWAGAAAGFAGLVAVYAKLESAETAHRLVWWGAAWRMGAGAPWLGLGPGAFAYALPSYAPGLPALSSLYAHQHFLETFAECGGPYLALWALGLGALLLRAKPALRVGVVAALVHGLVDYPLSVPGVFWLFCLSAAWMLPESDAAAAVRSSRRIPAAVAALAAAGAFALWIGCGWRADVLRSRAVEDFSAGAPPAQVERELALSEKLRPHPEAARMRAELALAQAAAGDEPARRMTEAAEDLERAVSLDPYRASNWSLLESVYRRLGRGADADGARRRGARTCPALRAEPA